MIAAARVVLLVALVVASAPGTAVGQKPSAGTSGARIVLLENKVAELERRVRELESLVKAGPSVLRSAPLSANWRDITNWRRLRRGMTQDQVRAILGEPHEVNVMMSRTTWTWNESSKFAEIHFFNDRVEGWSEPR